MKPGIRPLQHADIPEIAGLYELVMRSGASTPPAGLPAYFERTLTEHPWVDPEIPSLVYKEADGEITGFIGSHVRRFILDGTPVRLGCGGQLVAHPLVRHRAVGALLMQRYLAGAQDFTITDTASVPTHAMWGRLHGEEVSLSCINWTRVFRPWRFSGDRVLRDGGARLAQPVLSALDALTTRLPARAFQSTQPALDAEELTPAALVEALDSHSARLALRPDYDEGFLTWLFGEMARVTTHGTLVRTLLRDGHGEVLGWYVYYLRTGGTSQVVQVMADERAVGAVIDHLFHHAKTKGSAAVRGRLEPRLLEPLARRHCILRYEGGALIHSRNPELLNAVAYGRALLTRMDSEWWMGHHLEALAEVPATPAREPVRSAT